MHTLTFLANACKEGPRLLFLSGDSMQGTMLLFSFPGVLSHQWVLLGAAFPRDALPVWSHMGLGLLLSPGAPQYQGNGRDGASAAEMRWQEQAALGWDGYSSCACLCVPGEQLHVLGCVCTPTPPGQTLSLSSELTRNLKPLCSSTARESLSINTLRSVWHLLP